MHDFRLPVLGYHSVGPREPGLAPHLVVSAREFEQHLDWLVSLGYRTLRLQEVIDAFEGRGVLPPHSVLLTFDDGYRTLASTAFPALAARGMSATVFVVTQRIGEANVWDAAPGGPTVPLLTHEEIAHWHSRGIQFGAHTRTHPSLPALRDDSVVSEIAGSAEDLRALLGGPVNAFAYPYGHTDARSARAVADAFPLGFSSWHGINRRSTKRWMLRRSMVEPDTNRLILRCHLSFGRLPWESLLGHLSPRALVRYFGLRRRMVRDA
ncbi:MAG: polysaccharide deacetylase family protein [Gemmatimonadota bacterium]